MQVEAEVELRLRMGMTAAVEPRSWSPTQHQKPYHLQWSSSGPFHLCIRYLPPRNKASLADTS